MRLLVWIVTALSLLAQTPAFEVASIKPNQSGSRESTLPGVRNGRLFAENVTLKWILMAAYGMSASRVIGPEWLDADRYDLSGKSPEGVPDTEAKPMLQALLRDRFKLEAHSEQREMPVYELLVAKGGVKMPIYPAKDPPEVAHAPGAQMIMWTGAKMDGLASSLANVAGGPVIDKTGLTTRYNVNLVYAPLMPRPDGMQVDAPDLFTAMHDQLGLRLQSARAKVEVIVVDRMERKPTEN